MSRDQGTNNKRQHEIRNNWATHDDDDGTIQQLYTDLLQYYWGAAGEALAMLNQFRGYMRLRDGVERRTHSSQSVLAKETVGRNLCCQ